MKKKNRKKTSGTKRTSRSERKRETVYMCVYDFIYICWFEYFHIEKIRFQNQQPTVFKQLETASNRNETRRPQWNNSKNHNKWWWSISRKWFTICVCGFSVSLLEIYRFLLKFSVYPSHKSKKIFGMGVAFFT